MADSWRSTSGSGIDWSQTPFADARLIGEGGMGAVFSALDQRIGRRVALKLQRRASPEARARFEREAQLAASLQHANVVQVHGIYSLAIGDLMVCELVEGARPIDEAWRTLDLVGRIGLLRDAAAGIAAAHALGIVHRDIKPDNVLVDSAGRARVSDFGVAFSGDLERLTRTGTMVGTPNFMSPEQLTGERSPSPAADVWALGVLLYLALTDDLPFHGESIIQLAAVVASGVKANQARALSGAPGPLRDLVHRSLTPSRERRLQTAQEFTEALEAWLEDPQAGGPSRWPWALAGVLVVALLGGAWAFRGGLEDPQVSPSSTSPTQQPTQTPDPVAALARDLDSETKLVAYQAALELVRRFPDHPRARDAGRIVRRSQGRPLLKLEGGGRSESRYYPEHSALVSLTHAGVHRVWRPGRALAERELSADVNLRLSFLPDAGMLLHPFWKKPGPGLRRVDLEGNETWIARPEAGEVTAATLLVSGGYAVGGVGELRVLSPQGQLESRKELERGEIVLQLEHFRGRILCLTVNSLVANKNQVNRLLSFSEDLSQIVELSKGPGYNDRIALERGGTRVLHLNSHYGRLTVVDLESGKSWPVFSPTDLANEADPLVGVAWGGGGDRAWVSFNDERGAARIEAWSTAPGPAKRLLRISTPKALSCQFSGPGPDFATLGTRREVQVWALPQGDE